MINKKNIFDADWKASSHGEKFQHDHIALTDLRDGHEIGCGAFKVNPGKRAFPKHAHLANDEALFIVSGAGTLTMGEETAKVTAGDFVLLPSGVEHAHVLINDSAEDIVYLCVSTMNAPEVVHYPDSGKLGVMESARKWGGKNSVSGFYKYQKAGYYDGED
ncbi:MAG: cupin domain-containing protein [Gammaproteobacteria bacterium]|nr:cupin domain-containing protein [Gammaproteobacteria bacterium]MCP4090175.1 cupin domain-containing protein [Gammaproteobacteria bacterium]MCP4277946.1 cupin domain-containing protein [Gammaproteobacteria bacterium]MCP4832541.1 cupin domain-containing protein [Gammaproteobacteria bacterium]MCP4928677.1 cupin domain-containing protein [Gammaproteobacteria bacterium]